MSSRIKNPKAPVHMCYNIAGRKDICFFNLLEVIAEMYLGVQHLDS